MGGTRCTYRNCTIRSNGVTHMFHYPVFDKVRCHQWLTNAHRLVFLNLKVSQLKNRVVCQHHFKADNFMNYMMDKLRHNAVPTENGPFCDEEDWPNEDYSKALPIVSPEDIENDHLTLKEKRATFSVKYGDFLINSDTEPLKVKSMDLQHSFLDNKESVSQSNQPKGKSHIRIISEKKLSSPISLKGKLEPVTPSLVLRAPSKKVFSTENPSVDNIENMEVVIHNPVLNSVDLSNSQISFFPQLPNESQNLLFGQTSLCLTSNKNVSSNTFSDNVDSQIDSKNVPTIEHIDNSDIIKTPMKSKNMHAENHSSPKTSLLKNSIPPERIAAIEEKRKFNKKLRDMIEFCLDDNIERKRSVTSPEEQCHVELPDTFQEVRPISIKALNQKSSENHFATLDDITKEINSHKMTPVTPKESKTHVSEWNMISLETKLKKMEENLLRKIDQNAQRIVDLKGTIQKSVVTKYSVSTQTKEDEEQYKKQLFQEISQFLRPGTSSLVFEDLFLNQYSKLSVQKVQDNSSASKRRKKGQPVK